MYRKRQLSAEPDRGPETGRETADQQRHKYRRLIPNEQRCHSQKSGPESSPSGAGHTRRDEMLQRLIQTGRQAPCPSTSNPSKCTQDPSSKLYNPSSPPRDDDDKGWVEVPKASRHLNRHGPTTAETNGEDALASSIGVAFDAIYQHQRFHPSECHNGLSLSPQSRVGGRQQTLVPLLSAESSPGNLRLASEGSSARNPTMPSSAFISYHPAPIIPQDCPANDWDDIDLSIPSPTMPVPHILAETGFPSVRISEWHDAWG